MDTFKATLRIYDAEWGSSTIWFQLIDDKTGKKYEMTRLSLGRFREKNKLEKSDLISGEFTTILRDGRESLYPVDVPPRITYTNLNPKCCGKHMETKYVLCDEDTPGARYRKWANEYYKIFFHCTKCDCYEEA